MKDEGKKNEWTTAHLDNRLIINQLSKQNIHK